MSAAERRRMMLRAQGFTISSSGRVYCDSCEATAINGVACHERGCPNKPVECRECGAMHASRDDAAQCCTSFDQCPDDPDNYWIDPATGERIKA